MTPPGAPAARGPLPRSLGAAALFLAAPWPLGRRLARAQAADEAASPADGDAGAVLLLQGQRRSAALPFVGNTWAVNGFQNATDVAWSALAAGGSRLDAVEAGCSFCERERCDGSVGYGGSPDEAGETTLDAMIMDGETMDVGSVSDLRWVRDAISVARFVMNSTTHTMLAGESATDFAVQMGFTRAPLTTEASARMFDEWRAKNCQPNYWKAGAVVPDPSAQCGPYRPRGPGEEAPPARGGGTDERLLPRSGPGNHDTIGMVVVDADGRVASGTSTNGASHKVHGRVGDSPIAGAGSYARKGDGACGATGDGDQMMRLLPCYQAVESMAAGKTPADAASDAIARVVRFYPNFQGGIIVVNAEGEHAGACRGWGTWSYTWRSGSMPAHAVSTVACQ